MSILTPELVEQAIEFVKPVIEEKMRTLPSQREHLAIFVGFTDKIPHLTNQCFTDGIGDPNDWQRKFDDIAFSKGEMSIRTGKNTSDLPPHYRGVDDTIHWGSVVYDDIVVACSGDRPFYDEMWAMWIAATIKAFAKARFEEIQAKCIETNEDFIG